MGRSWQGRRTRRTNLPTMTAADRRRAEQEAADLAEAEQQARAAYARGGEIPPYRPAPDELRAVLSPGAWNVPDGMVQALGPALLDRLNEGQVST